MLTLDGNLKLFDTFMESVGDNMGFIDDYIEYHGMLTDAPDLFARMEAIFMIGAVMGKRFVNPLNVEVRHNFFMFFVAPTSRMRKSTSLKIMTRLLRDIDMVELPGEVTPESLIEALSQTPHSIYIKDEFGGELSKMSRKNSHMSNFMDVMCKLWEEYDRYTRQTIGGGNVEVIEPYLSAMLATTDDRFEQHARNDFVMSGFLPRFMMLFPDDQDRKPYQPLYYPSSSAETEIRLDELFMKLKSFLLELYTGSGQVSMMFEDVNYLNDVLKQLDTANVNPTLAALFNKMSNYVIKLADVLKICDLSIRDISTTTNILVENEYIQRAYSIIRGMIKKYSVVFENRIEWGNPELGTRRVLGYIRQELEDMSNLHLTRYEIQTAVKIDARTFDDVMDSLVLGGSIIEIVINVMSERDLPNGETVEEMIRKSIFVLRDFVEIISDHYSIVDIVGQSRAVLQSLDGIVHSSENEDNERTWNE